MWQSACLGKYIYKRQCNPSPSFLLSKSPCSETQIFEDYEELLSIFPHNHLALHFSHVPRDYMLSIPIAREHSVVFSTSDLCSIAF